MNTRRHSRYIYVYISAVPSCAGDSTLVSHLPTSCVTKRPACGESLSPFVMRCLRGMQNGTRSLSTVGGCQPNGQPWLRYLSWPEGASAARIATLHRTEGSRCRGGASSPPSGLNSVICCLLSFRGLDPGVPSSTVFA
ncbi:unnamed protein product [Protopolystoma xenopodis]|uniref:Uncharacterized protein n=1 Tax=Protopolystoma xenopodis TaxID=117903 RepID=A0A448WEY0_9PLAT|nr:unnamed protein product [Protopolystoma xenopodis]